MFTLPISYSNPGNFKAVPRYHYVMYKHFSIISKIYGLLYITSFDILRSLFGEIPRVRILVRNETVGSYFKCYVSVPS